MARPEGVGHADHVEPLGVAEVLRRQRRDGPRRPRAVAVAAGQLQGLIELPELLASLQGELVGRHLRGRAGYLPRLHLAVVEPVLPCQDPVRTS